METLPRLRNAGAAVYRRYAVCLLTVPGDLRAGNAVSDISANTGIGNISFGQWAAREFRRISGPRRFFPSH